MAKNIKYGKFVLLWRILIGQFDGLAKVKIKIRKMLDILHNRSSQEHLSFDMINSMFYTHSPYREFRDIVIGKSIFINLLFVWPFILSNFS